eukprot:Nitzschia sp. Nitz4//scaffold131_size63436//57142//57778//NITZ4_006285-RA/size63436-snap-gene-0.52-mRNA-1//-1//CDS//3329535298//210//frame0
MTKKSVRIDLSNNKYYEHYCLEDLTADEYDSMWVTTEDFMTTKREYVAVVRQMMKTIGEFQETEDCCPRGLEFKTKAGAKERKRIKRQACQAVLDEQYIQREEGLEDPEFLSDVYREMSGPSALQALNRGLKDQKAMLELLGDEERLRREQLLFVGTNSKATTEIRGRRRSITETLSSNDHFFLGRR